MQRLNPIVLCCFNLTILNTALAADTNANAINSAVIPIDSRTNLQKARDHVDLHEYHKALQYYKKQLELDPRNADLYIEIARVANWLNNHEEAIVLLLNAMKVAPARRFDFLRPLAWQYIAIGKPEKAIVYFNEFLAKYPKDIPALNGLAEAKSKINSNNLNLARSYFNKKQYDEALVYYEKQLKIQPKNSDLLFEIAKVYDTAKKPEKAIEYINQFIQVAPQRRLEILRLLGFQYIAIQKIQLAKSVFNEYLSKFPDDPETLKGLAIIKEHENTNVSKNLEIARTILKHNDYTQALIYYEKQLVLQPDNVDLLIEVARVDNLAGKHNEAIHLLLKAMELDPKRRLFLLRPLAWQNIAAGDPKTAIYYFKEFLQVYPHDEPALKGLAEAKSRLQESSLDIARTYFDKKQYDTALFYYKEELNKNPRDADLLFEIAKVYDDYKKPEDSLEYVNKFLEVAPERRRDIIRLLGWQYFALKKYELAKLAFEEYLLNFPEDSNAKKGLELSLKALKIQNKAKKNKKHSLTEYKELLNTDPNNVDLLIDAAGAADDAHQNAQALNYLQKAVELQPEVKDKVTVLMAWQYIHLKNDALAKQLLEENLHKFPKNVEAKFALKYVSQSQAAREPLKPNQIIKKETITKEEPAELVKARELNKSKQFKTALIYFIKALNKDPKNIDLLIEAAKAADDAKEYQQAIAFLKRVITLQPSKRDEVLILLAWQYYNIKNKNYAIALFEDYAARHPKDTQAFLALAQIYEDMGNNYKAYDYYLAAECRDNTSLEAHLGEAKTLVNLRRYTEAKKKYNALREAYPQNKEVQVQIANLHKDIGLYSIALIEYERLIEKYPAEDDLKVAYAKVQYWSGYDELALKTLAPIQTQEAKELKSTIKGGLGKSASVNYNNFFDTDRVAIQSGLLSAEYHVPDTTININPTYRIAKVSQFDFTFPTNTAMVSVSGRIGTINSYWGTLFPFAAIGGRNYSHLNSRDAFHFQQFLDLHDNLDPGYEWTTVAWGTGFKWIPRDLLKVYFTANNQTVENIRSIRNKVLYTSATLGFDYNFYPPATFTLEGNQGEFDDGNIRRGLANKITVDILNGSGFTIGVNDYFFNDSRPEINRGYYNPQNYYQAMGFLGVTRTFWKCQWNVVGNLGAFMEVPGGPGSVYEVDTYVEKSLKKYGVIRVYYSQSHSYPNTPEGSGYGVKNFGITYSLNFDRNTTGDVRTFNFVNNRGAGR